MKNFKSIFKTLCAFAALSSVFLVACKKENGISTNEVNPTVVEASKVGKYDQDMVDFAKSLATSMKSKDMRTAIKNEANKQFDDDYDILWARFKGKNVAGSSVLELVSRNSNAGATSLKTIEGRLPLLNIAVPVNIDKWNVENFTPVVAVIPSGVKDSELKQIKAYDADGKEIMLDAQKRPDFPVIVIGNNERLTFSESQGYVSSSGVKQAVANLLPLPIDEDGGAGGDVPPSTPSYCVNFYNSLAIGAYKSDNLSSIEGWFKGAPELVINILGGDGEYAATGKLIANGVTNVPSRSVIDGQWFTPSIAEYRLTWFPSYGDVVWVDLIEQDGNAQSWLNQTIEVTFADKKYSTNVQKVFYNESDPIGKFPVSRTNCMPFTNGNTSCYFRMVN